MTSLRAASRTDPAAVDIQSAAPEQDGVLGEVPTDWLHRQNNRLPCWFQRVATATKSLAEIAVTAVLSDVCREILRLGEPLAIEPAERVHDLPSGILNVTRQSVGGFGAAECQQVCSGFAHSEHFLPDLHAGDI